MLQLSDQDLLSRLQNFEDYFVERKTSSDKRDWLKTVVGFANSAPVGYPAVLFIGVRDDGTIEGTANLDKLQQTFSGIVSEAYPPIATFPKVLERDGKQFLAVIIP
ncbi:MAG: helix-turn-helix domain-containing protein, partial [Terriglobia bacterium]